jgi:integrase
MATTVRKKGKRWQGLVRAPGYQTQSQNFRYKADADRWVKKIETEISDGKFFPTKRLDKRTLLDAIDRYEQDDLPRLTDQATRKLHLSWWADEVGQRTLLHLCNDLDLLQDAKRKLEKEQRPNGKTRSPTTVKRYLASLSRVFSCTMNYGWCESNPVRRIGKPKEPPGRVRFLSEVERKELLKATANTDDPYLHTIVLIALCTGARLGEIQGLAWSDVSCKRQTLTFSKTKNKDTRTVPITDRVVDRLSDLSKVRRINSELVFPRYDGLRPKSIRAAWDSAIVEAGIKDFRFHDLRHTAASYLAMSGASPSELAAILGHRTLLMVSRYAHVGEQHTARILQKMTSKYLADGE